MHNFGADYPPFLNPRLFLPSARLIGSKHLCIAYKEAEAQSLGYCYFQAQEFHPSIFILRPLTALSSSPYR